MRGVGGEIDEQMGDEAERREHAGRVLGELAAHVTPVVPDDDATLLRVGEGGGEVRGQPVRRGEDDGTVHPVGTAAEHAAEAGGAELERAREAIGELGARGVIALRDERAKLGLGVGAGIGGDPSLDLGLEGCVHRGPS